MPLQFTIHKLRETAESKGLIVTSETNLVEFHNKFVQQVRVLESLSDDQFEIMRGFMKFLQDPMDSYTLFYNTFCLNETGEEDDHSAYSFMPSLKASFSSLLLQLMHNAFKSSSLQSAASNTSAPKFIPVSFDSIPSHQLERLSWISGWVLMRCRQTMPAFKDMVSNLGHDVQNSDNRFHVQPHQPYLQFFHKLQDFIFQRLTMPNYHIHKSQLANTILDNIYKCKDIHLMFKRLFPSHHSSQDIVRLLQEISSFTIKSAIDQFLTDNGLKPKKQSFALRVTVALGGTGKRDGSPPKSTTSKPKKAKVMQTSSPVVDCETSCKRKCSNWVCCDKCSRWFHVVCVGLTKSTVPKGSWFCVQCNNEQ